MFPIPVSPSVAISHASQPTATHSISQWHEHTHLTGNEISSVIFLSKKILKIYYFAIEIKDQKNIAVEKVIHTSWCVLSTESWVHPWLRYGIAITRKRVTFCSDTSLSFYLTWWKKRAREKRRNWNGWHYFCQFPPSRGLPPCSHINTIHFLPTQTVKIACYGFSWSSIFVRWKYKVASQFFFTVNGAIQMSGAGHTLWAIRTSYIYYPMSHLHSFFAINWNVICFS